jgi:DNA-binding transcriptional MerR regulator
MVTARTEIDLSVEELADRTATSVRTIRYYQQEGVLPPPIRRGRAVRYDQSHVDRLWLIAELQAKGLRLAAIRDLLLVAPDTTASDWLGLGETLAHPWSDDSPVVLSADELAGRLEGAPDGAIEALVRTGVIERRADTSPVVYFVPSPGLLEVAVASARLGLAPEAAARLRDLLEQSLHQMANELVAEFTESVSLAHLADQGPGALAQLLDQLRPLTRRTVDLLFAHEMERAQRELLEAASSEGTAPVRANPSPRAAGKRKKR